MIQQALSTATTSILANNHEQGLLKSRESFFNMSPAHNLYLAQKGSFLTTNHAKTLEAQ